MICGLTAGQNVFVAGGEQRNDPRCGCGARAVFQQHEFHLRALQRVDQVVQHEASGDGPKGRRAQNRWIVFTRAALRPVGARAAGSTDLLPGITSTASPPTIAA